MPVSEGGGEPRRSFRYTPLPMSVKRTLATAVRHEIEPIQGSRFVADAIPVADAESAVAAVEAIQAELQDASHHCWAYRPGPGRRGVSRFGCRRAARLGGCPDPQAHRGARPGRRAGRGDALVRRHEARCGRADARIRRGCCRCPGTCRGDRARPDDADPRPLSYGVEGRVKGLLASLALVPLEATYGVDVAMTFEVPAADVKELATHFADATAGAAIVEVV